MYWYSLIFLFAEILSLHIILCKAFVNNRSESTVTTGPVGGSVSHSGDSESSCSLQFKEKNRKAGLDIFWINLDNSINRRKGMEKFLEFYGLLQLRQDLPNHFDSSTAANSTASKVLSRVERVSAFEKKQVILPTSIATSHYCLKLTPEELSEQISFAWNLTSHDNKPRVVVASHCGRPKNTLRELTVTLSHLLAWHFAISNYSSFSSAPYALILEDDLHLAMEIDFDQLLSTAPKDFSILQLITSNDYSVSNLWKVYLRHKQIWVKRKERDDYWCAAAYIINKAAMKAAIDKIFYPVFNSSVPHGQVYVANIVAAYTDPCWPKYCCIAGDSEKSPKEAPQQRRSLRNKGSYSPMTLPCVRAARGYQSDNFLYSLDLSRTYMITLPMLTNDHTSNLSTVHQTHVDHHQASFRRARRIMKLQLTGQAKLPSYANSKCLYKAADFWDSQDWDSGFNLTSIGSLFDVR